MLLLLLSATPSSTCCLRWRHQTFLELFVENFSQELGHQIGKLVLGVDFLQQHQTILYLFTQEPKSHTDVSYPRLDGVVGLFALRKYRTGVLVNRCWRRQRIVCDFFDQSSNVKDGFGTFCCGLQFTFGGRQTNGVVAL